MRNRGVELEMTRQWRRTQPAHVRTQLNFDYALFVLVLCIGVYCMIDIEPYAGRSRASAAVNPAARLRESCRLIVGSVTRTRATLWPHIQEMNSRDSRTDQWTLDHMGPLRTGDGQWPSILDPRDPRLTRQVDVEKGVQLAGRAYA